MAALADLGDGAGGPPTVRTSDAGLLEVNWPDGRPDRFEVTTVVFESLVDEANAARRTLTVLAEVASALAKLAV